MEQMETSVKTETEAAATSPYSGSEFGVNFFKQEPGLLQSVKSEPSITNDASLKEEILEDDSQDGSEQHCGYDESTSTHTAGVNEICSTSLGNLLNVKYESVEMDIGPTVLQHMDSHYTINKNMSTATDENAVVINCNEPGNIVKKENIEDGSEQHCVHVASTSARTGDVNETCSTSLDDLLNVKYESAEMDIGPTVLQHMDSHYTIHKRMSAGTEENSVVVDCNEATPGSGVKKETMEDSLLPQKAMTQEQIRLLQSLQRILHDHHFAFDCSVHLMRLNVFQCDLCHAVYTEKDMLRRHLQVCHTQTSSIRQFRKTNKQTAVDNKATSHNSNQTTTVVEYDKAHLNSHKIFDARFINSCGLTTRVRVHTGEKPYKCKICKATFTQNSYIIRHMRIHTGEKPYQCKVCDARFALNHSLTQHMRVHTGEKPYLCKVCDARFSLNNSLTRHMRVHTGEKPYQCKVCDKRFALNDSLAHHMRVHTGEKPYQCKICKANFTRSGALTKHVRVHTGEKPYQCKICGLRFAQMSSLTQHMKVHTGEKPYQCKICKTKFTGNSNLTKHMRVHTGEKPYQCEVCDAKFRGSSDLTKHVRVHTGENPYQCKVCDARFACSSSLTQHMKVHTGEKPYQCKICEAKFTKNNNLTNHMRVHTGEKPYQCKICDARFTASSDLTKHVRVHTGQKPYQCKICDTKFAQISSLTKHMKVHTGEESYQCKINKARFHKIVP